MPVRNRDVVIALAAFIDPERAATLLHDWDAGEQCLALENLAGNLGENHVPLPSVERAQLVVVAQRWGVDERVNSDLRWCPDLDADVQRWRIVEGTDEAERFVALLGEAVTAGHD